MKIRFTQAASFKNTWKIFPQQTVKLAEKCHCVITDVAREDQHSLLVQQLDFSLEDMEETVPQLKSP